MNDTNDAPLTRLPVAPRLPSRSAADSVPAWHTLPVAAAAATPQGRRTLVHGRRVGPIELKIGAAVGPRDVAGLRRCMRDLDLQHGLVVYGGDEPRRLGGGIELLPRTSVARVEIDLPIWQRSGLSSPR